MYIKFKIILGATVHCKDLEVTVACPYCHVIRAQGILLICKDDGPCETKTCSSEARLIININLEVFVVVMVLVSLLHIVIHNRMHTGKMNQKH
jgi:hypothetical protein